LSAPLAAIGVNVPCNSFKKVTRNPVTDTCPCVTSTVTTLDICSPFVTYPISPMLNSPFVAIGIKSDPSYSALTGFSCLDCQVKATEFACLSAFPMCNATGLGYNLVSSQLCTDSLTTCRVNQLNNSDTQALLGLFTSFATQLGVALPSLPNTTVIANILAACNSLPPNGFMPINYTSKAACLCEDLPATSQCSGILQHQVVSFLGSNMPPAFRTQLEGLVLGQKAQNLVNSKCQNCGDAVTQILCNAAYPTCTNGANGVLTGRTCLSDCMTSTSFCDDLVGAQAVCSGLVLTAALSPDNTCLPLTDKITHSCVPAAANYLIPSFLLLAFALVFRALF